MSSFFKAVTTTVKNTVTRIIEASSDALDYLKDKIKSGAELLDIDISKLEPMSTAELWKREIQEREELLGRLILSKTINNICAPSGVGKSNVGISAAGAMASGSSFMNWRAEVASRVLYVDGEMLLEDLQKRTQAFAGGLTVQQKELLEENLFFVNCEDFQGDFPGITTEFGQDLVYYHILKTGAKVVFLDNFTALMEDADVTDEAAMKAFLKWLKKLRFEGVTVVTVNHSVKNGDRKGSVILDTYNDLIIDLKKPKIDNRKKEVPIDNGEIEFIFTKARHLSHEERKKITYILSITESGFDYQILKKK